MNYMEVQGKELEGRAFISNAKVYNLGNAVRGSKLPMAVDKEKPTEDITKMSKKLGSVATGTGHDCYLKGIIVVFDLTMSVKMSVQLQRYHFIDFVSSQSAMHKISKFDLDEQYMSYVDPVIIARVKSLQQLYNDNPTPENYLKLLYSNPCGFKLTGEMTTNYLQLKTIYHQRKHHRLPEWKAFCEWCESLPYFQELVLGVEVE